MNTKIDGINVEIRIRLNPKADLLHKLIERKVDLFGHIARMDNSGKIKSVLMGKMDGDNRKGSKTLPGVA